MPTPDEIIGSGANIVNPDQAAIDILSQRQSSNQLLANLSNAISMADGDAVTPQQMTPQQMTPPVPNDAPPTFSAADLMAQTSQQSQADNDNRTSRLSPIDPNGIVDGKAAASRAKRRRADADAMVEANARAAERGLLSPKSAIPPLQIREAFDADAYNQTRFTGTPRGGPGLSEVQPAAGQSRGVVASLAEARDARYGAVDSGVSSRSSDAEFESFRSDFQPEEEYDEEESNGLRGLGGNFKRAFGNVRSLFQPREMVDDSAEVNSLAPASRGKFLSHKEATARADKLRRIHADTYAFEGKANLVGTPVYEREVQAIQANENLAENPDDEDSRFYEEQAQEHSYRRMGQFKTALGFGALEIGQAGGRAYAEQNRGNYLTPEQQQSSDAGLLPGIGGVMGAAAGLALGSPIAGGLIGAGIGSVAQGVIGGAEERGQATREGAERLAASLGAASDTVAQFKSQIEATGAPVQQLTQGLSTLQGLTPGVGAAAIAGAGRSALSQGEYFGANTAETGRFLSSSPALAPLLSQYAQKGGELSRGQFGAIADLALSEGDMGAFNTAQMQAARAARNNDPAYQKAATELEQDKSSYFYQFDDWSSKASRHLVPGWKGTSGIEDAQAAADKAGAADDALAAADSKKYTETFLSINKSRQEITDARVTAQIGMSGFSLAEVGGASAASLKALLGGDGTATSPESLAPPPDQHPTYRMTYDPKTGITAVLDSAPSSGAAAKQPAGSTGSTPGGLFAALDAASAADQSLIDLDTAKKNALTDATDPTGSLRVQYQNDINAARADQIGNPLKKAELNRKLFGMGVGEEQSNFSLFETKDSLSGMSARDMQAGYDRQASYLSGIAADPRNPLSPTERAGIEQSSLQMRYNSAQNVYGEENRNLDITRAQRQGDISRAETFGTPQDAYTAGMRGIQSDRDQLAQNNSELQRGNLTNAQRQQIARQNIDIQTDIDTGPEKARINAYDSETSILGNNQAANRAGLSRAIAISGVDAFTAQTFTDDQNNINNSRGARDGSPAGSAQYAKFNRQYQDSVVQQQEDFTASVTFRETAAERTTGAELSGEQFRANRLGGVGAQDAALRQAGRDASLISDLNGKRYDTSDPLAKEANTRARQGYEDDMAEQTTRSQTYSETVQDRTRDSNINSAFRRAMKNPYQDGDPESNPFTRGEAALGNLRGELTQAQSALSKSTDPNAILANTERVNDFKSQITDIEAMRRTAMLSALPEFIGGAGGRGVLSGVLPTEGQSSFYNSNPYITGSFGKPNTHMDSGGHPPAAGGVAGNFLAATGHAAPGGADANTAILSQIRDLLQRGALPGGRSPAMPSPSGYSQNTNLYADTQRASLK